MHACTLEQKSSLKKIAIFFALKQSWTNINQQTPSIKRLFCLIELQVLKHWRSYGSKHLLQYNKCYYALIMPVFYMKHYTFSRTFKKEIEIFTMEVNYI